MSVPRTILVTGGSRGIGEQIVYEFARLGYAVALTYHVDRAAAAAVGQRARDLGAQATEIFALDLRNPLMIAQCADQVRRRLARLDVLVNNAGVTVAKKLRDQSPEEVHDQLNVNLAGVIEFTRQLLPVVSESIVNIGSSLAFFPKQKLSVYSATKFGLRAFTSALAKEEPNLRMYAVHPSLTATRQGRFQGASPEAVARLVRQVVVGEYRVPSGRDIVFKHYRFGPWGRPWLALLDVLRDFWSGVREIL